MLRTSLVLFAYVVLIVPSADDNTVVFCNDLVDFDFKLMASPSCVRETPTLPALIQIASIATAIAHRSNHLPGTIW